MVEDTKISLGVLELSHGRHLNYVNRWLVAPSQTECPGQPILGASRPLAHRKLLALRAGRSTLEVFATALRSRPAPPRSGPHRRRRATAADPDPAVLRVAPGRRVVPPPLPHSAQLVGLDRLPLRRRVEAEQPRGVPAQDPILDLIGQWRIAVLLDQVVGDLQPPQTLDLALRAAVPDRVGPPEDVVGPRYLDHLPEQVHAGPRG